jgi:repressor LexA
MLTERQQAVFDFIVHFRRDHGCSPSIPEIQKHFQIRSPNGVVGHLQALEAKGYIKRSDRGSRQIDLAGSHSETPVASLPIYGYIPAGYAEAVEARTDSFVSVDEATLGFRPKKGAFALRVRGDSMKDASILDGDLVIVEPAANPRENQIVAALIDGESTLKRLVRVRGEWFLKAENPAYPELRPRADLGIQGVVRTVIRRMNGHG